MNDRLTIVALTSITVFFAGTPLAAQLYDDGGVHAITGTAPDTVVIRNGPAATPTTVLVGPSADVPFLEAFDDSVLDVSGGSISHAWIRDSARVMMGGGEISHLTAYNSAQLRIEGNSVIGHLETHDAANAVVLTGDLSHLRAYDGSRITVDGVRSEGGSFVSALGSSKSSGGEPAAEASQVDVLGGEYSAAFAQAGGVVNLHRGTFAGARASSGGTINVFDADVTELLGPSSATVNVFGGKVASLWAADGFMGIWGGQIGEIRDAQDGVSHSGDVHIYGLSLHYSGVFGDRLTGVLSDGTAIDAPVSLERNRLHLHVVPEPEAAMLALLCLVSLALVPSWVRRC